MPGWHLPRAAHGIDVRVIALQAKLNEVLTDDAPPEKQKRDRGDLEAQASER